MAKCCTVKRDTDPNLREIELVKPWKGEKVPDSMVLLEGGEFLMGTEDKDGHISDGEGPVRKTYVDSFYLDAYAVSNARYLEFIKDTGYRTDAEKYGWSFVFLPFLPEIGRKDVKQVVRETPWWGAVEGASWLHPEGPCSSIEDRMDHPVVHVSWQDAMAFCQWSGMRLPTEAEWEFAARGGTVQKKFPWGDDLNPDGEHRCNIWQGNFPHENEAEDEFLGTAPVHTFEPNGYGLYNMTGNTWEWCSDWFSPFYPREKVYRNPQGPAQGDTKIIRGGSFLCHESYCNRYRVSARTSNTIDSSTTHMGFRCAKDSR
ncbi:formylglycine-generating enzyme family protein [Rossellomorea oryzaecorticis]|uniref:Formylglycine-generating enzyme family protein n=1 Tax=Rossellomorea oryzaecorticis TaxID=1396505 RepID=A0ABU9K7E0_9BACI